MGKRSFDLKSINHNLVDLYCKYWIFEQLNRSSVSINQER